MRPPMRRSAAQEVRRALHDAVPMRMRSLIALALIALPCPSSFAQTSPAASPPDGMRLVPAGRFWMGRNFSPRQDEMPRHAVGIDAFFLDETLVTVEAFSQFVERTGYKTAAEQIGYGMVAYAGL